MRQTSHFSYPALAGLLLLLAAPAAAIEIATGSMLGPRYGADRFYVRNGLSSGWLPTYAGGAFRSKV
ncbi:MAG: hypothetical protein OXD30_11900, partial [Bryobacterales bacterium]|nr:hypothetical protein [Bryobacterales bacterium]